MKLTTEEKDALLERFIANFKNCEKEKILKRLAIQLGTAINGDVGIGLSELLINFECPNCKKNYKFSVICVVTGHSDLIPNPNEDLERCIAEGLQPEKHQL